MKALQASPRKLRVAADPFKTYVINRGADADRMADFTSAAEAFGAAFERVPAFDAHDPDAPLFLYRTLLRDAFWGETSFKPGALGCAVSHMTAWRRMLANGCEVALICEDDTRLIADPSEFVTRLKRYPDAELIFANHRMTMLRDAVSAKSDPALITLEKMVVRLAAKDIEPGAGEFLAAPGADAYFITRSGAEKLLSLVDDIGLIAGVDWLMLAGGVSQEVNWSELATLNPHFAGRDRVNAYVARDAISEMTNAPSAIIHKMLMPIGDLRDGPSLNTDTGAKTPDDLRPDPVADAFRGGRFYEEPALAMMARWMPQDGVFVDVGAHVGNHSLFMLKHGGAGRTIPFEHNKFAIAAYQRVMEMNDLSHRVKKDYLGFGLAEETGKREAKGGKRNPFVNRLKPGFDEPIRVRPGDALLREEPVDMIKVDVNGEEREVLKGLKKTLKRKAPLLVVDMTHPRAAKALPLIERHGYVEAERAKWDESDAARLVVLYRAKP